MTADWLRLLAPRAGVLGPHTQADSGLAKERSKRSAGSCQPCCPWKILKAWELLSKFVQKLWVGRKTFLRPSLAHISLAGSPEMPLKLKGDVLLRMRHFERQAADCQSKGTFLQLCTDIHFDFLEVRCHSCIS